MPRSDEADLVARLRSGDDSAYEHLFRTHAGAMTSVARRFFGDAEAAEAVQDAFVSAFRAMTAFEGTAKLGTWLHRITVNACLLKLRGRKRSRLVPLEDDSVPPGASECDTALSQAETCERVREGVAQLPEAYRTVIRLRDLEGLSTEEAAVQLGTNCGAVKTRLHRARQALRSILESQFANAV